MKLDQPLFGVTFQNPILLASGTCGYGEELDDCFDIDRLGGLVTKAVTANPRVGNAAPRVAEFYESAFCFRRVAADEGGADLELGGFELSFRRGETATREGIQIGFKVETAGEVDGWAQELSRRGFALVAPPSGDRWEGTRSFRVADPDGRQVAIFYDYPQ